MVSGANLQRFYSVDSFGLRHSQTYLGKDYVEGKAD